MRLRCVDTHFWSDSYIVDLDPIEKLLFLYLLTNPSGNLSGCFERPVRQIAFDTGIDREMVAKILARFEEHGKIIHKDGWIILLNFLKHQKYNANMIKSALNELNRAPAWVTESLLSSGGKNLPEWLPNHYLTITEPLPNHSLTIKGREEKGREEEVKGNHSPADDFVFPEGPYENPAVQLYEERFHVKASRNFAKEIQLQVKDLAVWSQLLSDKTAWADEPMVKRQGIAKWILSAYKERLGSTRGRSSPDKLPNLADKMAMVEDARRGLKPPPKEAAVI